MNRIGIDLGGTKIEGIVLDENGKELARKRVPTQQEKGYQAILDNIQRLYETLRDWKAAEIVWLDELRELSLQFPPSRDLLVHRLLRG